MRDKEKSIEYRIEDADPKQPEIGYPPSIKKLVNVEKRIPEFNKRKIKEGYYSKIMQPYNRRLTLLARHHGRPIGFLASYDKYFAELKYFTDRRVNTDNLHLWMAGVVPGHRGEGLMSTMIKLTAWWARELDYKTMSFKTFRRFKHMISLAEKLGFRIDQDNGPKGIIYKKTFKGEQESDFHKSEVFKKYKDRFSLDVSWNVQETLTDRIKEMEKVHGEKMLFSSYYKMHLESGRKIDLKYFYAHNRFEAGDDVEIGLNSTGKAAWLSHPGTPLYLETILPPDWPDSDV